MTAALGFGLLTYAIAFILFSSKKDKFSLVAFLLGLAVFLINV